MDLIKRCPFNSSTLDFDQACLTIQNSFQKHVDIFSVSSECYQCNDTYWMTIPLQSSLPLVVSAVHSVNIKAVLHGSGIVCEKSHSFNQHEFASLNIKDCTLTTKDFGDNAYLPLYVFAVFTAILLLLGAVGKILLRTRWIANVLTYNSHNRDFENDLGNPNSSSDSLIVQSELVPLRRVRSQRIKALDTFRGITISLMIFVNYGGGKYWFFEHSAWNGLTIADLVFPWFAWVMGVSLVLSYRSKLRSCQSRLAVLRLAAHRSVALFALGLLVNMYGHNDLATARYCGVLQRLALAHLIVAVVEIAAMKKQPSFQREGWLVPLVLRETWRQWLVIACLVAAQVGITLLYQVPGCPRGYTGPGGAAHSGSAQNCTGGVARLIDSWVFGDQHLYQNSRLRKVYHTVVSFDPEGLLGTLTTCLTVYLGVHAGYIILCYNSTWDRVTRWFMAAMFLCLLAGVLCGWTVEGGLIPINKQLWSLSFACLTSATAFLALSVLFTIIDHMHWWSGSPFRHAGMNAILLYIGHIVTKNTFPWSWKPHDLTTHAELLSMNICAVLVWLVIARLLYRNEIFLTV